MSQVIYDSRIEARVKWKVARRWGFGDSGNDTQTEGEAAGGRFEDFCME